MHFTYEKLNKYRAENDKTDWSESYPTLLSLLSDSHNNNKKLTRNFFSECFRKSAEHAAILLVSIDTNFEKHNLNISHNIEDNKLKFTIADITEICELHVTKKHRVNVISGVLEEILWHVYRNSKSFSLSLEKKVDDNIIHFELFSADASEQIKIVLRSSDFVRTKIITRSVSDPNEEWSFDLDYLMENSFGWNQDNVNWHGNHEKKKDDPPRSFLTFRDFTDSLEASVFLVSNKGIEKYNESDDYKNLFSEDLEESFTAYIDDKIESLNSNSNNESSEEQHKYALSVCCGARFSHANIGSAYAVEEGDELLGVFFSLYFDGFKFNEISKLAEQIYMSGGIFKYLLFQNLARENSYYQNKEQQILKKQAQMLELLQTPLDSLTEALIKTQQDTQTLRSILYDPHKSLFSVAALVENYFEEDRSCSYGKVKWKGFHKPDIIKTQEERHAIASILSVLICNIYGEVSTGNEDELIIYRHAESILNSDVVSFKKLQDVLNKVLFSKSDKKGFLNELKSCLLLPETEPEPKLLIMALKNIKQYIFEPFKYGGSAPVGPMALIFYDYDYSGLFNKISVDDILEKHIKGKKSLFLQGSLPVPRYSDLLSLVSGILAYAKNEKKISGKSDGFSVDVELKKSLKINFPSEIFNIKEIKETLTLMKTVAIHRLRKPQGNFRKPLFDFAAVLLAKNDSEIKVNSDESEAVFSVQYSGFWTHLYFKSTSFSIQSEKVK